MDETNFGFKLTPLKASLGIKLPLSCHKLSKTIFQSVNSRLDTLG